MLRERFYNLISLLSYLSAFAAQILPTLQSSARFRQHNPQIDHWLLKSSVKVDQTNCRPCYCRSQLGNKSWSPSLLFHLSAHPPSFLLPLNSLLFSFLTVCLPSHCLFCLPSLPLFCSHSLFLPFSLTNFSPSTLHLHSSPFYFSYLSPLILCLPSVFSPSFHPSHIIAAICYITAFL